jgi:hypothetical protein
VESSCRLGIEPSGSIKCWEIPSGCTTCGLSTGTQLHRVSYILGANVENLTRLDVCVGLLHPFIFSAPCVLMVISRWIRQRVCTHFVLLKTLSGQDFEGFIKNGRSSGKGAYAKKGTTSKDIVDCRSKVSI